MNLLIFLLFFFTKIVISQTIPTIKIGLVIPRGTSLDGDVGFNTSAGSVSVAVNRAIQNQIYNPAMYNISFTWAFGQCDESLAAGYAAGMIHRENISALIGPSCIEGAKVLSSLSTYKKIPHFIWSTMNSDFTNRTKFPMSICSAGTMKGLVLALKNVLLQYNWTQIGFLYSSYDGKQMEHVPFCPYFAKTVQDSGADTLANISIYSRLVTNTTVGGFHPILTTMNTRARVIVACLESTQDKQNFMKSTIANGMTGPDYIYLFIQTSATGFGSKPFWESSDPSTTASLKMAAKNVLILDKYAEITTVKESVDKEIVGSIKGWPFYCTDCPSNVNASSLAFYLGDAIYTYLAVLNMTYVKYGPEQLKNGTAVLSFLVNNTRTFPSIMGNNFTMSNGFRTGRYALIGLDQQMTPQIWAVSYVLANESIGGTGFVPTYKDEFFSIWSTRGGKRPLAIPVCGFNNTCPPSPIFYASIGVASVFLFVSVLVGLGVAIFLFQKQQKKSLNALWQIPFVFLQKPESKKETDQKTTRSQQSDQTRSSGRSGSLKEDTEDLLHYYFNHEVVVAHKVPFSGKFSSAEQEEFRKMRKISNVKLNKFLGVAVYGPHAYLIWSYCERGSIVEVIKTHAFRIDSYIQVGMMREVAEGLHYIHDSSLQQHGALSAYKCVVGDRFDVKIQCYGCRGVKERLTRRMQHKSSLYVAPEHLNEGENLVGSQAGDIYSFSIIASMILNMKPAYGLDENDTDAIGTTVNAIARGRFPPVRPTLDQDAPTDIDRDLFKMIRRCWSEMPSDRPKIEEVRETLLGGSGVTARNTNLMDHMFALMENSASELESDVKQRTLELLNEQKKSNILLYKIMPKQAADKLKLGQTCDPEVFDQATVFFSDIVSFTVLASKSTPLQTINFLNDLYTLMDEVLEKYDVYKVETIGDGMHVVSGVPKRNGTAHVKNICLMAIDFQRAIKLLKLGHLPDQKIQMRVGVHSGSCVAGIVGITNPRYIVLGDTVNISAKMEAGGKAGRIHITQNTKDLLEHHYPNQFHIFERGETLVKNIGPLVTYWLALPEEAAYFEV